MLPQRPPRLTLFDLICPPLAPPPFLLPPRRVARSAPGQPRRHARQPAVARRQSQAAAERCAAGAHAFRRGRRCAAGANPDAGTAPGSGLRAETSEFQIRSHQRLFAIQICIKWIECLAICFLDLFLSLVRECHKNSKFQRLALSVSLCLRLPSGTLKTWFFLLSNCLFVRLPSISHIKHTHRVVSQLPGRAETAYRAHDMKRAIEAALEALYATNKHFQDAAPWALGTAARPCVRRESQSKSVECPFSLRFLCVEHFIKQITRFFTLQTSHRQRFRARQAILCTVFLTS